ncbi:hypothetical protein SAMN05660297_02459 [Natronincola peptidivorans]|uniref:Uncharacterized protein n=1 Tax=Natronincola peptidivorans TaxID=426128 RepID=A0A1I0EKV7_9FIRM|nr:hypothetical protein [Natronincola peptidivorans]SET45834.1 hypothetical protein SAMN05660297_02459 [Natronincola peptidivorans]
MEGIEGKILKAMDVHIKGNVQCMTMEEIRRIGDLKDTSMMRYMINLMNMRLIRQEDETIDSFTITRRGRIVVNATPETED